MTAEQAWVGVGLFGQLMFTGRFLVQWLASERKKKSVIPNAFWYFSIGGALMLLAYAIYRRDPVFIIGQSLGLIVYFRNLQLIQRSGEPSAVDESLTGEPVLSVFSDDTDLDSVGQRSVA